MLRWKQERNGSTALLIEGARRVGKSTLVEEFAKKEYKSYISFGSKPPQRNAQPSALYARRWYASVGSGIS